MVGDGEVVADVTVTVSVQIVVGDGITSIGVAALVANVQKVVEEELILVSVATGI